MRHGLRLSLIAASAALTAAATGASSTAAQPIVISPKLTTIPYFTSSFAFHGHTYTYRMPGTDPRAGPQTTRIGADIIPLRFVFANGVALSARPKVEAVLDSPLFTAAHFLSGDTQYGDAMLRAQFWSYARRESWHVLLAPKVGPQVQVMVPASDGWVARSQDGGLGGNVSANFFLRVVPAIISQLGLDPHRLTVLLAYHVALYSGTVFGPFGGQPGTHGVVPSTSGSTIWTWVEASWADPTVTCCHRFNVEALSKQLAAWQDNPFVGADNVVPPWRSGDTACLNTLELDAYGFGSRVFPLNGYDLYDPPLLSWFARQKPSIGIRKRYDYLGALHAFPASCRLSPG